MKSALTWIAAGIGCVVVLVIGFLIAAVWTGIGDSEISGAGWLAMGLGVVVTLALGIGLMALVFISNRRGYDEIGRRETAEQLEALQQKLTVTAAVLYRRLIRRLSIPAFVESCLRFGGTRCNLMMCGAEGNCVEEAVE